jgi:hypothetical protein
MVVFPALAELHFRTSLAIRHFERNEISAPLRAVSAMKSLFSFSFSLLFLFQTF